MSIPSSSEEVATRHGIWPCLQQLLDLDALLPRERPVMGARDVRVGELVEPHREPLGEAPVVDEDDRRAVLLHEVEQRGIDRGPDRPRRRLEAGGHCDVVLDDVLTEGRVGARLAHVLERDDDLEVELLAGARVDELDRPAPANEPSDLLERPLRRREADALERLRRHLLEPFE